MLDREPNDGEQYADWEKTLLVDQPKLKWGYSVAVPPNVKAAWGARLILEQDARKRGGDLVANRQSSIYADQASADLLQARLSLVRPWEKPLAALIASGEVRSDRPNEVVVYEDEYIKSVGNSNGSFGYFYIAVWLQ